MASLVERIVAVAILLARAVRDSPTMLVKRAASPADLSTSIAPAVIGRGRIPRSVRSSGRAMPSSRQASASSAMRPGPKRMGVG